MSSSSFAEVFLQNSVLKIRSTNEKLLNPSDIEADIIVSHTCLTGLPFLRMLGDCGHKKATVKIDVDGNFKIPEMDNPSNYGSDVASQMNPNSYHSLTIQFFDKQSRSKNKPLFSLHKQNQEILSLKENFDGRTLWLTPIPELKLNMSLNGDPILGSQLSQGAGNYLFIYFSVDRDSNPLKNDTSVQGDYDGKSFFIGNIEDRSLSETSNYLTISAGIVVSFDEPAKKILIKSALTEARTEIHKRVAGKSALVVDASNEAMSSIGTIDLK